MDITKNKSLKGYNTFGIDCSSSFFARISSLKDLDELYRHPLFKSQKKYKKLQRKKYLKC